MPASDHFLIPVCKPGCVSVHYSTQVSTHHKHTARLNVFIWMSAWTLLSSLYRQQCSCRPLWNKPPGITIKTFIVLLYRCAKVAGASQVKRNRRQIEDNACAVVHWIVAYVLFLLFHGYNCINLSLTLLVTVL